MCTTKEQNDFDLENISILIVDDDNNTQRVIKHLLNKDVDNIDFGDRGFNVLDIANKCLNYDIILIGIQMPQLYILELCKTIRKSNIYIPIIALIPDSFSLDMDIFYQAGMNSYLIKPIVPLNFYQVVTKWFTQKCLYEELFDFEQVRSIFGNNIILYIEMGKAFFERFKNITFSDIDKEFVHKLKGSAGSMGFKKIMEISIKLHNNKGGSKKELIDYINITKRAFNELFSENFIF